jgi:electron transfer flavoprotein alpha/beta subunit
MYGGSVMEEEITAEHIEEQMASLHNRFVAYISEAQVPLPFVITVLELLLHEAREQAIKKYLGE